MCAPPSLAGLILALLACPQQGAAAPAVPAGWRDLHARIAAEQRVLASDLARARQRLQVVEPPPPPLAAGYLLLPPLEPDVPDAAAAPVPEKRYALDELAAWVARERERSPDLARVEDYRTAVASARRIEEHLAYHAFWQEAAERGALPPIAAVPSDGFTRASGLVAARAADGACVLRVPLATDIEDDSFLAAFADAVEREWSRAPAMATAGLRLELAWTRCPLGELYPEGPPPPGAAIDLAAHRRRFGAAGYVLTTGGSSTHAEGGALVLGPAPVTPRVLAHELGHVIGFHDGYRRGFAGAPGGPSGVVLLEVVDRPESLMAAPGHGRVTADMAERLREEYFSDG